MEFEKNPTENYAHGLVFQSAEGEVEAVGATFRELVNIKAKTVPLDEIRKHELEFSMWPDSPDRVIFTNYPIVIAQYLEEFFGRTKDMVKQIVEKSVEPDFDSDDIARRIKLGKKAFQLAGFIKLEFDNDTLQQMLDDQGAGLFTATNEMPSQPYE